MPRFPHLAALTLALCTGTLHVGAQDALPPATAERATLAELGNSPEALATAARNILELVEVHTFRMRRIDAAITHFGGVPDMDKVRQFSLLREREQLTYQKALNTYRRLLGEQDFERVAGVLRNHFEQADVRAASEPERRLAQARAEENAASAAARAERVRAMMAAQAQEARQRREELAAKERSQLVARMRASQRAQLAQRLAQARAEQLVARDAAARRYKPTPEPASQRRADPSQGGFFPGGLGGGRGRGFNPWQTPAPRR